jgi:hypothetical protein
MPLVIKKIYILNSTVQVYVVYVEYVFIIVFFKKKKIAKPL